MKKTFFTILFFIPFILHAQFMDFWTGKINVGSEITVEFNVTYEWPNPKFVTLDCPEQYTWDLECKVLKWSKDSFNIAIPAAGVKFFGKKEHHDSVAVGIWMQGGLEIPLTLTRSYDNIEPVRPQNPPLEHDYIEENVNIINAKDSVILYGTLTIPAGFYMRGCAVLVSGSGKQDKEETMVGHKPFWVIADYLTRNGYAVLRFDDRGSYRSSGNFETSTIYDFANDVNAALDLAKERTGLSDNKLGLIGHSEGSMVSQIVLKERPLGFFISLAGPAAPIKDMMIRQNRDLCDWFGITTKEFDKTITPFLKKVFKVIGDLSLDSVAATEKIIKLYNKSSKKFSEAAKARFSLGTPENVAPWITKSTRTFIAYDPASSLSAIQTPMLALNGTVDKQVNSQLNLTVFKKYLGNNLKNEIKELENKNHLFQTSTTGDITEYGKLEETFSPDALVIIRDWLKKVFP